MAAISASLQLLVFIQISTLWHTLNKKWTDFQAHDLLVIPFGHTTHLIFQCCIWLSNTFNDMALLKAVHIPVTWHIQILAPGIKKIICVVQDCVWYVWWTYNLLRNIVLCKDIIIRVFYIHHLFSISVMIQNIQHSFSSYGSNNCSLPSWITRL